MISVTVELDLDIVVQRLRDELGLIEEHASEEEADSTSTGEATDSRLRRIKHSTRKEDYDYN